MSLKKPIKILSLFILAALVSTMVVTLTFSSGAAEAGVFDADTWEKGAGEFFGDMFGGGNSISFTDYEGALATLDPSGYNQSLTRYSEIRDFVVSIVNFALGFLGLIAVLVVIYGGFLYVTAGGEEEKTQTGKKAITYAVIGLLIIMGSFALVNTIISGALSGGEPAGDAPSGFGGAGAAGGSYNAYSQQVYATAQGIYKGFQYIAETQDALITIANEANSTSLAATSYPTKGEITAFLYSAKSSLQTMKAGVDSYSEAETMIEDRIRAIDSMIDAISAFNRGYVKVGGTPEAPAIEGCKVGDSSFMDGFNEASIGKNNCEDNDFQIREGGEPMLTYWNNRQKDTFSINDDTFKCTESETCLYAFYPKLVEAYKSKLTNTNGKDGKGNGYIDTLEDVNEGIKTITAITAKVDPKDIIEDYRNFYAMLGELTGVEVPINSAGQKMLAGLEEHGKLFAAMDGLQFVKAQLAANTIEGSAPLEVIFSVGKSQDPAGGTIQGGNVRWDLGGEETWKDMLFSETGGYGTSTADDDDRFECSNQGIGIDDENNDKYADIIAELGGDAGESTILRCIFYKPGVYSAAAVIRSNDANVYGPGVSFLPIKVNPPTVKIDLSATSEGDGVARQVLKYSGETPSVNVQQLAFTFKKGMTVTLDASGTENSGKNTYAWDFGNGQIEDTGNTANASTKYDEPGEYSVSLEVTNPLGAKDRKFFTIILTNVVANIVPNTGGQIWHGNINETAIFDGSRSSASKGVAITNYAWKISKGEAKEGKECANKLVTDNYLLEEEGTNKKSASYKFTESGMYCVSLTVQSGLGSTTNTYSRSFPVGSQSPISEIGYEFLSSTQPGTVVFDGAGSYDPDEEVDLKYKWALTPKTGTADFLVLSDSDWTTSVSPMIKFKTPGEYEVSLKVIQDRDNDAETSETITKMISVLDTLDIAWGEGQEITASIDAETGKSTPIMFNIVSDNGVAYEIDYGDGNVDVGNINNGSATPSHSYRQAGRFDVKATVFNEDDEDNSIKQTVFISGGDKPMAIISMYVNGTLIDDVYSLSQSEDGPFEISRTDRIKFDAGKSINIDGTGRKLAYSWDLGDTERSSKREATHSYDELNTYTIKLRVYDEDEPEKFDDTEIKIRAVSQRPMFTAVQGVPQSGEGDMITPIDLNMSVYGGSDPDGKITQYRWWYFDVDDPDEELGMQVTSSSSTTLTLGTNGEEDEEIEYGFGLEITDNDGKTYCNLDWCNEDNMKTEEFVKFIEFFSTIKVTNGPNELPISKFTVDRVKAYSGEPITFTSASSDSDGNIEFYVWDFEGDGFFNNLKTDQASIEHIYTDMNMSGIDVRLKVIDDNGGEVVSDPLKIYIDSNAEQPVAAFTFAGAGEGNGREIQFVNNSRADKGAGAEIKKFVWDFDTSITRPSADSDGDGDPANDRDSTSENPIYTFSENGVYKVRLTVTDNQGNIDDIEHEVKVPLASAPVAAFTYEVLSPGVVKFKNNSMADASSGAIISSYKWDFDTQSILVSADSNGDGIKDNDTDSDIGNPTYTYQVVGTFQVKLTITDSQGNIAEVTNGIVINESGTGGIAGEQTVEAVLGTTPLESRDGIVYLQGEDGSVTFDFSNSTGDIAFYTIDKNIYFDTDGNGIRDDDQDFRTSLPGRWTTNFEMEWGRTVTQLIVEDLYGNESKAIKEIKFK